MSFTEAPETKLVPGMSFSDYCNARGKNISSLKTFDYDLGGCPALYRFRATHPEIQRKETKALRGGNTYHHYQLQRESFDQFYAVCTKEIQDQLLAEALSNKKCKAKRFSVKLGTYLGWKERQESSGRKVISEAEFDTARFMSDALYANPEIREEIEGAQTEVSMFAGFEFKRGDHQGKRFQLKARPDIVRTDSDSLLDLKSARTAHPRQFARQAYDLGYDLQGAFYLDCANANDLSRKRFGFVAQDTFAPYLACIHWIDGWLGHGRQRYTKILSDLADAITNDRWPGYPSGELEPPGWAMEEIEAAA